MEKLLLMGINTRILLDSASKLKNYQTYSVSYFSTVDFKKYYSEKHILEQIPGKSCGIFEENFNSKDLLELSQEYMAQVDKIVLSTGISPSDFKGKYRKYKKKIVGNQDTTDIENKYKFYKKIKNDFLVPKTFKFSCGDDDNHEEIIEILNQYNDKSFILKPLEGSGGIGVNLLNNNAKDEFKDINLKKLFSNYNGQDFLIQEYIRGKNISSSILSSKNQAKSIMISKMLTEHDFAVKNSFKYSGNILPYTSFNNETISNIAENLILKFGLIGSNGIDMIIADDVDNADGENIYIIEVNPRFQGTYECVEKVLGINLLEAHIKASQGELIHVSKAKCCSMKRIIYTKERQKIGNLLIENVYDIPYDGVIIEKNQPLATIISYGNNIKEVETNLNKAISDINKNIYSY